MKRLLIVLMVLLLLCGCAQKNPGVSSEAAGIPYEEMNELEKAAVSRIQNNLPGTDGDPFRTAIMINGTCYYGYLQYVEDQNMPTGAKYVGELLAERSEAYTTPTQHLQAEESFWTDLVEEVYLHNDTPYFRMDKGEVLYFADVTTEAPPYYDDGRWMLEAPKTE